MQQTEMSGSKKKQKLEINGKLAGDCLHLGTDMPRTPCHPPQKNVHRLLNNSVKNLPILVC